MTTYSRPNYSTGAWASEGIMYTPTSEKISLGHVVEKPPFEIVNYIENRQDSAIAYLLQVGIADWDRGTTYTKDAFVSFNGDVYQAQSQNSDRQPSTNLGIWKIKWAKSDDFESLKLIVNSIRNEDGYLTHYVSKNNPTMYGKCLGTSYVASVGLNSSGSLNVGYGFSGKTSDGIYHNGTNVVVQKNGEAIAVFSNDVDTTKSSNEVVRMKDLQKYMQQYRVGDIYLTTNPSNPATTLGYGTWERYAEGQAIVGVSTKPSDPDWTKGISGLSGSFSQDINIPSSGWTSSINELVQYNRGFLVMTSGFSENREVLESLSVVQEDVNRTVNVTQPSITVLVWRRTA